MLDETVGERVARLRERRRMTQAELSDATGGVVSEAWIAALEKNRLKDPPDLVRLRALAGPLDVSYAYLLAPLQLAPLDEAAPADQQAAAEQAISESDLSHEKKQAALEVIRALFR
jgi:transcriptional regulator with XRE-family HTH domain